MATPPAADTLGASRPRGSGSKLVLRNALVLTMDDTIGDFERADILIEHDRIVAVGPDLITDANEMDCVDRIIIPGFVNSHHHMFQTALRGYWSDALSADYFRQSRESERALFHVYSPDDVYWGQYVGALEQLNAGTTTVVDTSQCTETPEHTDAAVRAIRASGIRAVYAFCARANGGTPDPSYAYPQDVARIRNEFFSASDGLVTLALGAPVNDGIWRLAKEQGLPLFTHINDRKSGLQLEEFTAAGLGGDRTTYIHCTGLDDSTWRTIAESGAQVSLSNFVEQTLNAGAPGLQSALRNKLRPSLSTDAVSIGPTNMFSAMRATFALQRSRIQERQLRGEEVTDPVLDTRDVLRMATINGARAAHLEDRIGSITPGKQADLVVLNAGMLNASPVHHATGTVVMQMDTSNVETVLVAGQMAKSRGRLRHSDVETAISALRASARELIERSDSTGILLDSCRSS